MRTLCQELIKANKTTTSDAAFDKKCKNKFYILQYTNFSACCNNVASFTHAARLYRVHRRVFE